ncbi:MAG TPA: hypothetical protein VFS60_05080, partial [Thermoanaerobaculia bacterium]|nr:hypothetical protein [Thermoanaerobaculia bacterium]
AGVAGTAVSVARERATAVGAGSLLRWQLLGLALFLFIPLVLFLFVRHPEPVGASLAAGVVLMVGHRFLARPYMEAVRTRKCLWCNGRPRPQGAPLPLLVGGRGGAGAGAGRELVAVVCTRHREPAARFLAFLERARLPLRLGIFAPLLLLLAALVAAAFGEGRWLDPAVALFQGLVGITVNVAAFGYLAATPPPLGRGSAPARVPFPAHNFFLLGIRNLLWVFRLVGIWWIVVAVLFVLGRSR